MKIVLRILGAILLVLLLALGALLFGRGRTPALAGDNALAELRQVELGGDSQWVLVRGRNRCNPVLLFLHGGPGMPAMYLAHDFQRAWERDFTIVHWDRLGAGKSYQQGLRYDSFTVRRTLDDTHALAAWLRDQLQVPSVLLVGHSWGSYLGMLAAAERPDLYAAYVGTGQLSRSAEAVRTARVAMLRPLAAQAGDTALLRRLDDHGPITEHDLFRYHGELVRHRSFWPILLTGLRAREYTIADIRNVARGANRVAELLRGAEQPLSERVRRLGVPVYFLLGRHDLNTPSDLAAQYLQELEAPRKGVVWFEHAAHFPFWEQPDAFHRALLRVTAGIPAARVRPARPGCRPLSP